VTAQQQQASQQSQASQEEPEVPHDGHNPFVDAVQENKNRPATPTSTSTRQQRMADLDAKFGDIEGVNATDHEAAADYGHGR
jgi:hypothetical protein